ncbi:Operon 2450 Gene 2 signal peptide protein Nitrosomon as europaea ATCC 19718 gi [hydrothermal vent metagenome]|uniref:Operon 2450 Gene 2 signal peptide protein Nitrosomon as europaea ATCC 19718 gi n=1 Tax=hydrothermal vent metagenome TaxID=652676 RepID=A0A3B1BJ33_9ZZZZ
MLPSPNCGLTPTPAFSKDGKLWVVFVQNNHLYVTHSDDLGQTFAPPVAVNRVPEVIYHDGENRPKLAIGPQGDMYVSWIHRATGRFAGHVRFARSLDGAKIFDQPLTVNDDLAPISHRFDSMVVDSQGRIYIAWIDKRDLVQAKKSGKAYVGAAIYYALSENRGESFAFNRKVADHSCECCRIAMAPDSDGRVVALWRHVYPVNIRDHAITRLGVDTLPVRATDDGWVVDGCPHHGPDLALGGKDKAHMAWFTQGEKNRGIMYGRFNLATNTLETQHSIDASSTASRPQIAVISSQVFAVWKSFNGTATELRVKTSSDDGVSWSISRILAETADGSDYPLLINRGDELFASWHTRTEGYRLIPVTLNAPK